MTDQPQTPRGPDLAAGTPADSISDGVPLLGHVGGDPVILVRRGAEMFAIGATCSHYGGPLAEGLVVTTPSGARGTTPASAFGPATLCARLPSTRWRATRSSSREGASSSRERGRRRATCDDAPSAGWPRRSRWRSWVRGPPGTAPRRNCARSGSRAPSPPDRSGPADALRPAKPVQGLPGGHRGGGVASASPARLLRRARGGARAPGRGIAALASIPRC